jgi:hypothetical protein
VQAGRLVAVMPRTRARYSSRVIEARICCSTFFFTLSSYLIFYIIFATAGEIIFSPLRSLAADLQDA